MEHLSLDRIFHHLHSHPETSWNEWETTQYIAATLERYSCDITTFGDCPGVVAEILEGEPVVAVRADMDALWQEVEEAFCANHSCGHDAYMTIVIGVFFALADKQEELNGTVRFIFQPAEEQATGALKMVEKGIVDDAAYLFGLHLRPYQELGHGTFAPAIQHGAARFIRGSINGEDAHGARPHLNVNAIQVGAELNQMLHHMEVDPAISHSAKLTSFHAGGTTPNIIPGKADFTLDLRAQQNAAMQTMADQLNNITSALQTYHGNEIYLDIESDVAAAVIDEQARSIMAEAIKSSVGTEQLKPEIMTPGGDDFHFYTIKRPHLKATMLGIGCDLKPGLHHPNMTFNQSVIPDAVTILKRAILTALAQE
ncbi:amidohydrolase [Thalassobacillus sp. CUG 92003]|uniref:amidohydrolase n=1 Tax=Thalassobacillus sp. CUG 92003 TaxID=2736641 RepID=UPI0015E71C31|nr:amidohydrolase [Thalassobacillus sp. CUG 92003]